MLDHFRIINIVLFMGVCCLGAIIPNKSSTNNFQTYLNSIKKPNIDFKELYDKDSAYDADLILHSFASLKPQPEDYDFEEESIPCKWSDNTKCTQKYEPVCVTDLNCIYVISNKCMLDKLNCGCPSHHILPSSFCENFTQPSFKRCNIKIFIQ